MQIKAVLFDLDGTLLPMDLDEFIKSYVGNMAKKVATHGYDPKQFVQAIWAGTLAMVKNNGNRYNESVFWDEMTKVLGDKIAQETDLFDEFYKNDYKKSKICCGFDPMAKQTVDQIKNMGLKLVLATNPLFPAVATQQRMEWAGVSVDDFEFFTTYENSHFSKPNPNYYKEVISQIGLKPEECLMVGNDVDEDMVAQTLGIKVFLLPKHIINRNNKDTSQYPQGDFNDLLNYIKTL